MPQAVRLPVRPTSARGARAARVADGVRSAWFLMGLGVTATFGVLGVPFTGNSVLDSLIWLGLGALGISGLGHLAFTLSRLIRRPLPSPARTLIGVTGILVASVWPSLVVWMQGFTPSPVPFVAATLFIAGLLTLSGLLGAGLAGLGRWREDPPAHRRRTAAQLTLAAAGLTAAGIWLLNPPAVPATDPRFRPALSLSNPALPGPYPLSVLHYGSGVNQLRPEFGARADVQSRPIDARAYVRDWPAFRTRLWGFSPAELPLNATVWLPGGTGPFPLVLIVHGAHRMTTPSDPGYAYLGQLLASRGFIAASVDENFLNGGPLLFGAANGIGIEARALVLLEHLRQWQVWNDTPGNPFTGRVDLSRVALVGHSRGGEAVALAAAFCTGSAPLPGGTAPLSPGLRLRAVAALAPSEGQAGDSSTLLRDVNYLVLQGSQDADARTFMGVRQYQRVTFTPSAQPLAFKAAVYIDRANHGEFNTRWGRNDYAPPLAWFLNVRPVLPGEQQREIARVYLSAFLEATLHGQTGYLPLFQDPRRAGRWLPGTRYVARYADARTRVWADFEFGRAAHVGMEVTGRGTVWQETRVPMAYPQEGSQENTALQVAWNQPGGDLTLSFPQSPPGRAPAVLSLDLAVPTGEVRGIFTRAVPDLTLVLRDAAGHTGAAPLSRFATLSPPFWKRLSKWTLLEPAVAETVFQTVHLPLKAFAAGRGGFDPTQLSGVTLRVDRSASGTLLIDNVALTSEGIESGP